MFHNNIVKIKKKKKKKKKNKRNLFKSASKLPSLPILHNLHLFLLLEEVKIFNLKKKKKKTTVTTIKFHVCIGKYDKWFCIKSWQSLQIYFFCVKALIEKRLSGRCRKHSRCMLLWSCTNTLMTMTKLSNWAFADIFKYIINMSPMYSCLL